MMDVIMKYRWLAKLTALLEMIKFSHTVFAFPFALMVVVLAALETGRAPSIGQVFWICVAMVGARTGAMGLNRIIDAKIDSENPRTAQRHLPAGEVQKFEAWLMVIGSFGLMLFAAWRLNPLCLMLAPVAIFFLALYSFCKRFTAMSHIVLGLCLAAAPIGAWIALRGDIAWPVLALGLAVLFWVAGFDIFYALQDLDFDRSKGLYSMPARFGIARSLWIVRLFHILMVLLLLSLVFVQGLGLIYLFGVFVVGALLVYEHQLVKPEDLSQLDAAFFNMNGYISVTIFLFTLVDALTWPVSESTR
jgi:4-hydroxybenzoate polyprenyltransferase